MENSVQLHGRCPKCGGLFRTISRTVLSAATPQESDVLQWQCLDCWHAETEERRFADGPPGEWPASKFSTAF
jgi:hypothetical protein